MGQSRISNPPSPPLRNPRLGITRNPRSRTEAILRPVTTPRRRRGVTTLPPPTNTQVGWCGRTTFRGPNRNGEPGGTEVPLRKLPIAVRPRSGRENVQKYFPFGSLVGFFVHVWCGCHPQRDRTRRYNSLTSVRQFPHILILEFQHLGGERHGNLTPETNTSQ